MGESEEEYCAADSKTQDSGDIPVVFKRDFPSASSIPAKNVSQNIGTSE